MTTRGRGRRSSSRGSKPIMLWYNNGVDLQSLAASTSITAPLLTTGVIPEAYLHGMTILRLILRIAFSQGATNAIVNAVTAFYVGTKGTAGLPPNLNADLANYYYYGGLQLPLANQSGSPGRILEADIRTKRRIRGEDTDLFWRVTNNEATDMQVGMEMRILLQLK